MKRRILVITSSFPRGEEDLAGHFVRSWAQALTAHNYTIHVLAWRGAGAVSGVVGPGVRVDFVPYGPRRWERLFYGKGAPENLERSPVMALMAVPAMAAMVRAALKACGQQRYDAVVGHWLLPGGFVARVVGQRAKIPSFVVGHSGGVHLLERLSVGGGRRLARFLSDGPTTVPTRALHEKLVGVGGLASTEVAPMGFEPILDGERAKPEGMRVGFLGRFVPIKGLEVVLEAVKGLPLTLEVVGDGPARQRWEQMAGENTRFFGARYGEEKAALIRGWQAMVVPSIPRSSGRHEGLPVSLLEGASAGAIPFVSGVPGVEPWLARPERQILNAGDRSGWRGALMELLSTSDEVRSRWQEETRRQVAPLSWPVYGEWWARWLDGGGGFV